MHARGLFLIGSYQGSEPVTKRDGGVISGFRKVKVVVTPAGAEPYTRDASYNTADRDTGEATPFSLALDKAKLSPGDEVAIKVTGKASAGGYVNLEALAIVPVETLFGAK